MFLALLTFFCVATITRSAGDVAFNKRPALKKVLRHSPAQRYSRLAVPIPRAPPYLAASLPTKYDPLATVPRAGAGHSPGRGRSGQRHSNV